MSNIVIPKNILKRKCLSYKKYLDLYSSVGALKSELQDLPDHLEIQEESRYYEGDTSSYYVRIDSEESDSDYQKRLDNYVKRKTKENNYKLVSQHIIEYVKNNTRCSLDDLITSLSIFKGEKFGFRCSSVINELMADGYIGFNEDRTKVLFFRDFI